MEENKKKLSPEEKAQKNRDYMRAYMKAYKAKQYEADPEKIKREKRSRYLAAKDAEISAEDKKKYGKFLHTAIKATELLKDLVRNRPDLLPEVLNRADVGALLIV
jgi:hypothetical protein